MNGTVKVRITPLRKDVTIYRLTSEEVRERFLDDDAFKIPLPNTEEIVEGVISGEGILSEYSPNLEYMIEYSRILSVLYSTVKDFHDRCVPELLEMPPEEALDALFEIYDAAVISNPSLDIMTYRINNDSLPLPRDLEEVVGWLPKNISTSIKRHMYEDSVTDDYPRIFEETSDDGHVKIFEAELDGVEYEAPEIALDLDRVRDLPKELAKNVIGQSLASDHLYAVIRRLAVGFRDINKPPAVLLFAGPTGIGKTLMAKLSCEYLFDSRTKFGRIDCATLSERHDVSKLIGAPPGYVGYPTDKNGDPKEADPSALWKEVSKMGKDGGFLLLDEVEKAHPDIWDVFLTAFDEGYVKTSVGNVVDLRNVVIIMTTNLGSREFAYNMNKMPMGFHEEGKKACHSTDDIDKEMEQIKKIKQTALDALKEYMKPELIGRITDIVPFNDLDEEELRGVVDLEWGKATDYLSKKVENISIDKSLRERIAKLSLDKGLGARPVARLLEQYAIDAIAEIYVEYPKKVADAEDILIRYHGVKKGCDLVVVDLGEDETFDYSVKQSVTEDK